MAIFGDVFSDKPQQPSGKSGRIFGNVFDQEFEDSKSKYYQKKKRQQDLDRSIEEAKKYAEEAGSFKNRMLLSLPETPTFGSALKSVFVDAPKGLFNMVTSAERKYGQYLGEGMSGDTYVQAIQTNNDTINQWRKIAKEQPEKGTIATENIQRLMEQNAALANEAGGDVKNLTNKQMLGLSIEVATDFGTAIGSLAGKSILKAGTKLFGGGLDTVGTLSKNVVKYGGAGTLGATYGATNAMQENASAAEIAKSAALGGILGVGTMGAGSLLMKGAGKLKEKTAGLFSDVFKKTEEKTASEVAGQGAKVAEAPKPASLTPKEYLESRDNLTVTPSKTIGKDLEGATIKSRLEWDSKESKGNLLVTKDTTDEQLAHETGHYLAKHNPALEEVFAKETEALVGKEKNLNEALADSVAELIMKPEARDKAPKLAAQLEEFGLKLAAQEKKVEEKVVTKIVTEGKKEPLGKTEKAKLPSSVETEAKQTYKQELAKGTEKGTAKKKVVEKVQKYEAGAEKAAKETPIIQTMVEGRRGKAPYSLGTNPKRRVKTEGVNWSKVNTSKDTEDILRTVFEQGKDFKGVRPSRTNKEIVEGMRAVNIDESRMDEFLKHMPNANVAVKLKQMMVDSASDLMNYMKTALKRNVDDGIEGFTPEQLSIIKDKQLRTTIFAKNFAGLRTEASHLLRSFGIETFEGENFAEMGELLKKALGESGGDTMKFLQKSDELVTPKFMDKYIAVWYNFILSGWKTFSKNFIDNTAYFLTESTSKFAANPAEGMRFVAGMFRAFPEASLKAGRVFIGKEKSTNKLALEKKFKPYFENPNTNFWLTESAGRVLDTADTFQASIAKTAMKHADDFASRMTKAGISDQDTINKVNEAVLHHYSKRLTLTNEPISEVTKAISTATSKAKFLKFIIPFIRVVSNAIARKIDYIPVLNFNRTFWKGYANKEAEIILRNSGVAAGEWDKIRPVIVERLQQQQRGRLVLGVLASGGAMYGAQAGLVSGNGPSNKDERKQLEATGWRANSVKIGGRWVGFQYFGPLSGILAIAGSVNDAMKYDRKDSDIGTKISNGLVGFAKATLSQSYLSGVADVFDVMNGMLDAKTYVAKTLVSTLPIPNILPQVTYTLDRTMRDQKGDTFLDILQNSLQYRLGIAGIDTPLGKELPPVLNALGEEIRSDLIYGVTGAEEVQNLQSEFQKRGLVVSVPDKRTQLGDEAMTREQLWFYTLKRGELVKKNSKQIFSAVDTKKTSEEKKKEFDDTWMRQINEEAKNMTRKEFGIKVKSDFEKKFEAKLENRLNKFKPKAEIIK